MRSTFAANVVVLVLIAAGLIATLGCNAARGGADIYIEGISIGSVSMEGKPVTGLPSQKVNLVLNVNANKITIKEAGGKTTIKCSPSGATIVSGPDGITFTGVEPKHVEIKWQVSEDDD